MKLMLFLLKELKEEFLLFNVDVEESHPGLSRIEEENEEVEFKCFILG